MHTLSEIERKLLQHIANHIKTCGYQPSYREIAKSWGYRSPGYIAALVSKMRKRGVIKSKGNRALIFDFNSPELGGTS
jgi:SOS-response transcriptional repressor LexA